MVCNPVWYVATAVILFAIGVYPMVARRNMIQIVIGIEILTFGAHLNFLAVGSLIRGGGSVDALGQNVVVMSIPLGACVAAVALLLIIQAHRHFSSVDVRELRRLRW